MISESRHCYHIRDFLKRGNAFIYYNSHRFPVHSFVCGRDSHSSLFRDFFMKEYCQ